jgi:pimeloyl-ACP methyl ester carboxylesterase
MTVERVPGAGHFLPEERPGLMAERVREFFPVRAGAAAVA